MMLSDWLAGLGLVVGIAGFAITIWVVLQAKSAAEAARDAVQNTRFDFVRNLLFVLAPGLQRIEESLERAVTDNELTRTLEGLAEWRYRANQLLGLMRADEDRDSALANRLQRSVALAVNAKDAIGHRGTLRTNTNSVRSEMSEVNSDIQVFMAERIPTTREGRS